MTPIRDITVGMRVKWVAGSDYVLRDVRGTVERITAATVTVAHGDTTTRMRADRRGNIDLTPMSAADLAHEAWAKARPRTKWVKVRARLGESLADGGEIDLDVTKARTDGDAAEVVATLQAIALEVAALTEWVSMRPAVKS